jgi:hypothetical protein
MHTETGARTGGYFKYFEKEEKGVKRKMMIDVGEFYALDAIPKLDSVTFMVGDLGLLFHYFGSGYAKGTFFPGSLPLVFGKFVEITPL